MTVLYQFIAGIVFAAVTLAFLFYAFQRRNFEPLHYDIAHFVCSLCAGASGAFFTGSALLTLDAQLPSSGKLVFQATAGVALFALVFIVFRWRVGKGEPPPPKAWVAPPPGASFEQTATILAAEVGATVDLSALTNAERAAQPKIDRQIDCSTADLVKEALLRLRNHLPTAAMREYAVRYDATKRVFTLAF